MQKSKPERRICNQRQIRSWRFSATKKGTMSLVKSTFPRNVSEVSVPEDHSHSSMIDPVLEVLIASAMVAAGDAKQILYSA